MTMKARGMMLERPLSPDERAEIERYEGPFVSYGDVKRDLVDPAGLGDRVRRWRDRYDRDMTEFVLRFQHRALLEIDPMDVKDAIGASSHALGNVTSAENHAAIRDINPPWAMEYLFHELLEAEGRVPTWDAFRAHLVGPRASSWYDIILSAGRGAGLTDHETHRAMQWRSGNAWNALIRQTYLLASLRHNGIPVKYHMLAHVLLRVDGWLGDRLIYLWMPNIHELHKQDPRRIFGDRGFRFMDGTIERQGYGRVWLPSGEYIDRLADFMAEGDAA